MQLSEFGIDGRMLKWIHNFLVDRKIQVRVWNEISDPHTLEKGCPQDSVISPILFNAIINTLSDKLKNINSWCCPSLQMTGQFGLSPTPLNRQ